MTSRCKVPPNRFNLQPVQNQERTPVTSGLHKGLISLLPCHPRGMGEVSHTDLGLDESRAEVDTILASASFARSPRAARLLHYLCSKYFAGEAADIKEYNIALDVLGRPETFDPAQDAGVRVEVHRLRKKLREYYEREGSDHAVRVCIPTGSYIPVFGRPELLSCPPAADQPLQVQVPPRVPPKRTWSVSTSLALLGIGATLVFLGAWLHWRPTIEAESKAGVVPDRVVAITCRSRPPGRRPAFRYASSLGERGRRMTVTGTPGHPIGTSRAASPSSARWLSLAAHETSSCTPPVASATSAMTFRSPGEPTNCACTSRRPSTDLRFPRGVGKTTGPFTLT